MKMSIEDHVAMTEKHLREMVSGVDARAEADGVEKFQRQIEEEEPTAENFEFGELSDVELKFIHEQTVHNILRTIEDVEANGEETIPFQRKKELLRNALLELDKSLAIETTEHELMLREKIVGRLVDMERFVTERHVTGMVDELLDKPSVYQRVMEEAWEATLADPEARKAVNGNWFQLYEQAERILFDAAKQEKLKRLSSELERQWLLFMLRKLDAADAIMSDGIAHDMKAFALRKLHELADSEKMA
jgi:hypothetical protein